jgi:hypothetical protein
MMGGTMSTKRDWGSDRVVTESWTCSICGGPTVYQSFSGGREWYCEACDTTGEYPTDGPGLPRATLLRTPEGTVALRAQMDQELARLKHENDNRSED